MAIQTFGSIYIGSYEVSLKIFELSAKKQIREIDYIRTRLDLGRDVYQRGIIGYELVDQLCDTISEFVEIMKGYKVNSSEVYASAVFRDAENSVFVINQIFLRTCFRVKVLSNSEYRFIGYKSVAGREDFENMIQTSAAVVDIGGSGIQVTVFRGGQLETTQHMEIGTVRLRELLADRGHTQFSYEKQLEEFVSKKLEVLRSMYVHEKVDSVIVLNDYCYEIVRAMNHKKREDASFAAEKLVRYIDKLQKKNLEEICKELNLSNDKDPLIIPSMIMCKVLIDQLEAENVWVPGVNINDGIAYDYVQRHQLVKCYHDFDRDVICAAQKLSQRFNSYSPHISALEFLSTKIFDTMKKMHGMGDRERLLLQVAVILHDCGKYITLDNSARCAYEIIMSSEIIGLSHREREIVAQTVLFNSFELDECPEYSAKLNERDYLVVAKLSAILRLSNALDQSHKQKFNQIRSSVKGRTLLISVDATEDISLESALFDAKAAYFEKVFSIKPEIKAKRKG